ncbi:MAG: hypothetical protein JXA22_05060 [Candidatus Thermoplasmatota archaeon]|nr:hypothetical protein [Candidatus Thermoplasmatota archaeon]
MEDNLTLKEISNDEIGNIDVKKEIALIDKLGKAGFDIEGMGDLLFTDIEHYIRRRNVLVVKFIKLSRKNLKQDPVNRPDDSDDEPLLLGSPFNEGSLHQHVDTEIHLSNDLPIDDTPSAREGSEEELLDFSSDEEIYNKHMKDQHDPIIAPIPDHRPELSKRKSNVGAKDLSRPHRRSHMMFYIGVGAVVLMIMVASGSYLYLLNLENNNGEEEELAATFKISDRYPLAGTVLQLSADVKDITASYKWEILPENYRVISGGLTMDTLELYFTKPGTYRMDLSVIRTGEEARENIFIDVLNRQVTIDRERYGDNARYDINGHLYMENIDDMIEKKDIYVFETLDMDFWTENANPMTMSITDNIDPGMDGLAVEYGRLERRTEEYLRFSGTVTMKSGEEPAITGHSSISQLNHVDLYDQKSFRTLSDTITHISIPVTPSYHVEYDMEESLVLYPSLERQSNEFRIEDISENRNISVGDEGLARWGEYDLSWSADEVEIVIGRPSIKVSFSMDQATKKDLEIEEFNMIHWVADDIPVSVRMTLNMTTKDTVAHPSSLRLMQQMVSFSQGSEPVLYGSSVHRHETYTSADEIYPELVSEFHDDWEMLPVLGELESSIPSNMAPIPSLDRVLSSREYELWSMTKTELLVSYANYSRFTGDDIWNFHIAEPEDEWGWKANVTENNESGLLGRIEPITLSRSDLGPILTFSGAEFALKKLLPRLDRDATNGIYGRSQPGPADDIRTGYHSISVRVDHPYPRVGLIDPSLGGSIPYCMIIGSFDGTIEVGLDMSNGQIAYVQSRNMVQL